MHNRLFLLRRQVNSQLAGQDQRFLRANAVECLRRLLSDQTEIDRRTKRINIGPGTLSTRRLILLNRGITMFQCDGQSLISVFDIPCTAKINQPHLSILQHQIVRRDVPMDQSRPMQVGQCAEQWLDQRKQLIRRYPTAALCHQICKGRALDILHDNIGGVVCFKKVTNTHNHLLFIHLCHRSGFLQKSGLAALKAGTCRRNAEADQFLGNSGISTDLVHRIIFLDRHLQLQPQVTADVGDTKTAFSQHSSYQVSVHQQGSRAQMVGLWNVIPRSQPAAWTYFSIFYGCHAIRTILRTWLHFCNLLVLSAYASP